MVRKTRRVLRRQGFKLEPLSVVSLRIQPEIYERCGWAAEANGVNRNEWIRTTLADVTRDAKRPSGRETRVIEAPSETWEEWEQVTARRGHTVESLVCKMFTTAVAKDAVEKST